MERSWTPGRPSWLGPLVKSGVLDEGRGGSSKGWGLGGGLDFSSKGVGVG